ncbi:MAG: isoprenylcysteine carboxylmethyltransferase family protein [bacterium]
MNFTTVYVGFIIISSIHRIRALTRAYSMNDEEDEIEVKKTLSYVIMLFLYLVIFLGAPLEYFFVDYPKKVSLGISLIGFILYVLVIPLRNRAVSALGKFMSPDIEIKKNHTLIKNGPYKHIRHPLALCIILEAISLCLIPNSWLSLLFAIIFFIPFVFFRMHLEEKAMIGKFGEEYLEYKRTTGCFIPKIRRR